MSLTPNTRQVLSDAYPFARAAARTDEELDDLLDAWLADDMASAGIDAWIAIEEDAQ
jgi:hypothetical protein